MKLSCFVAALTVLAITYAATEAKYMSKGGKKKGGDGKQEEPRNNRPKIPHTVASTRLLLLDSSL
jgi:hypothetical protein